MRFKATRKWSFEIALTRDPLRAQYLPLVHPPPPPHKDYSGKAGGTKVTMHMILTLLLSTCRLAQNGVKRTVTRETKGKQEGTTICRQRTTLPVSRINYDLTNTKTNGTTQ